jgi:phage terminase Nu1 subunit (DNA packaging protein)
MLAPWSRREAKRHDALAAASKQRARLASAQADLAELKAKALRGVLLDAAEVERTWGGVLRTIRAAMLAVPSRIGARLPHLTAVDIDAIDREVRDALVEVAVYSVEVNAMDRHLSTCCANSVTRAANLSNASAKTSISDAI